jgi:hypothetical protein
MSGYLGTLRGSLSTSLPTPRVWVPRHVARLVVDYFASHRLVIDYFASRRLVVDYFDYATCPGALARHAARHVTYHRQLRLWRATGCLGTSRGSSRRSSSTTPPRPGSSSTTSHMPRVRVPRYVMRLVVEYSVRHDFVLRPHWLYFSHAVRRDNLSRGNTGSTSSTPRAATTSSFGHIVSTIHLD